MNLVINTIRTAIHDWACQKNNYRKTIDIILPYKKKSMNDSDKREKKGEE